MDDFISNQIKKKITHLKIADKHHIRDLFKMILDQHNVMTCIQSIVRESKVHFMRGGFVSSAFTICEPYLNE